MSLEERIESEDKKVEKVKIQQYTEAEDRLRQVVLNSLNYYRHYIFPEAYDIVKAKCLFTGDIRAAYKAMGETHKTAAVYPLLSSIFDSFSANLYDSVVTPKASARREENKEKAGMAQDFCDWSRDISDSESVKKLIRNEAALIGTSYGIAGWDSRSKEFSYNKNGETKTIKREISQPTVEHVSFFEMFYDPSTVRFNKARWKARRKILSLSEIEKRYGSLIEFTDETKDKIIQDKDCVLCPYDFTKIYEIKNYEHLYDDCEFNAELGIINFLEENVLLSITDENPMLELIEYRDGDNDLAIMINGRIYYDGVSPYPFGDPFGIVVYEEVPGTCRGVGIGQKIMPHQRQASFYFSKIKDAIGQHIDPMYTIVKGSIIGANGQTPQTIGWIPGAVLEIENPEIPNAGIKPINFVDFNIVNIAVGQLSEAIARAQETIGTNSYVQGGAGKVERSFGAANLKVAVTATRLKPINNSLGKFDEHMFETWLSLASIYMGEKFSVKVLGDEGYEYRDIEPDALLNKFDITVDIDAIRDLTKSERSQTILNMLNAIAPFNMNPISNTPTISPESIIKFIAGQMDYDGFNPMTNEERVEYAQAEIDIATKIQQAGVQPSASVAPNSVPVNPMAAAPIPAMDADIPFDQIQPIQ